jgi:hypothetical protein
MDHVEHTFKLIKHFLSSLRTEILGDMDWYFCSFKHLMLEHNYSNFHDIFIIHQITGRVHDELVGPSDIFWNSSKRAKTSLSLDWSISRQRVDVRCSKLSEVGARMGMTGLVIQMWTVLVATLESVSRWRRTRDRSPHVGLLVQVMHPHPPPRPS